MKKRVWKPQGRTDHIPMGKGEIKSGKVDGKEIDREG